MTGLRRPGAPAHADRPWLPTRRLIAAAVAGTAVFAAVGVGAAACLSALGPTRSTPTSAKLMTVPPSSDTSPANPSGTAGNTPAYPGVDQRRKGGND